MVNPSLYAKVPYDPVKDFSAVTLVAVSPNVVVVNPQVPAKTLPELVQLIRDNPGKYSYAGPGVGSTPHLGGELFRLTYKLDLVHVPFTGAAPAVQSTVGGHTPIAFTALPSSMAAIQAGQVRAIGIAATERSEQIPDVPTFAEQGVKDQEADTLTGIVAPAGTPKEIVELLSREIAKGVSKPEVKEQAGGARLQAGRQYAGRVRRAHQGGDREVGQGGEATRISGSSERPQVIPSLRPRQREPDAAADHEAAGDARHQPRALLREEFSRAAGQQRIDRVGHRRGHHEGDAEQRYLREYGRWLMSMNCGMNAPKNTSTFGFDSSTRKPCRKNPPRGGGGGASASTPSTGERISLKPSQTR